MKRVSWVILGAALVAGCSEGQYEAYCQASSGQVTCESAADCCDGFRCLAKLGVGKLCLAPKTCLTSGGGNLQAGADCGCDDDCDSSLVCEANRCAL